MSNWHEMVASQDHLCLVLALLGILLSGVIALLPAKLRAPALVVLALAALSPALMS
jgi:cytochrome b561